MHCQKVNDTYTVIWSGNTQYLQNNIFEWVENYQVFGQNEFKVGALVKASTNESDIRYGQNCLLTSAGVMNSATGSPDQSGQFTVKNEYGKICIGVNQMLNGNPIPIFVSPTVVSGTATMEPINTISTCFSQTLQTGTMIFGAQTDSIEVTYSGTTTEMTIAYEGPDGLGAWTQK